jgi:hypothetical protein
MKSLNSTTVRFIRPDCGGVLFTQILSQFHYGSIHTGRSEIQYSYRRRSQFHYGSIHTHKTSFHEKEYWIVSIPLRFDSYVPTAAESYLPKFCLNSTTVRFILDDLKSNIHTAGGLNSTTVRFIPTKPLSTKKNTGLSQFHYGSIHTGCKRRTSGRDKRLNSTTVRFIQIAVSLTI